MIFFKIYAFLFLAFVETGMTVGEPTAPKPLNFVYVAEEPQALCTHPKLNNNLAKLSAVATELLSDYWTTHTNLNRHIATLFNAGNNFLNFVLNKHIPQVHAFAHELPLDRDGVAQKYWFYVVVFKVDTKFITLAVLITDDDDKDKQIVLLDYYLGFNIVAFTIHKLLLKNIEVITTSYNSRDPIDQFYHKWLSGIEFVDYDCAKDKWEHVRNSPRGQDVQTRDGYIKVKPVLTSAADVLEKEFPVLLKGLKAQIEAHFGPKVQPISNEATPLTTTGNLSTEEQGFTILKYQCQEMSDNIMLTGFIFEIKGKCVLGVTVRNGIITYYKSQELPQEESANPYNVFLQKCQSLAIFLKENADNVDTIKAYDESVFGFKRVIKLETGQKICVAKFALTVSPWARKGIWMGLKYNFFNSARLEIPQGITNTETNKELELSESEKKFSYWRSTNDHGNSSWQTIFDIQEKISLPVSHVLEEPNTWLNEQNKYLDNLDAKNVKMRNQEEWKGISLDWATSFPDNYPYGDLTGKQALGAPPQPLFFKKYNPAADNIIFLPLRDHKEMYVLTPAGEPRWKTIVGERNRPPYNRALNGGFVELDDEVRKILGWIRSKYPDTWERLVKDICLLTAMKEFLEESKRIKNMNDDDQKALWLEYVELLFYSKDGIVKIEKVFSAATGDQRNRSNSYVVVYAYVFVVYHHPRLEAFFSQEVLVGGDDSAGTAIADVTIDIGLFANHWLLIGRGMLWCPNNKQLIYELITKQKEMEKTMTSVHAKILLDNINMLQPQTLTKPRGSPLCV